jgi:sulfonate transport system substrate-binding protein
MPVLAWVLLTSCAVAASAADQPEVLRFAVSSIGIGGRSFVGGSTLGLVHSRGLLEEEFKADGIKVEWIFNKGAGPQVNEELAAGLADMATLGDLPSFTHRVAELRTKLVMAGGRGNYVYLAVLPTHPATSLLDLVGKRMAIHKGTATQLLNARILALNHLQEQDFKVITLDASSSLPALFSGDVDCLWGGTNLVELEEAGKVRIVYSTRDIPAALRPCSLSTILAREEFEQRYPDIVQRVVTVFVRAADWAADPAHLDQVVDLWSKSGTTSTVYRRDLAGASLDVRLCPLFDAQFLVEFHRNAQGAYDTHLVRQPVDFTGWIETKYLDHALIQLGLTRRWIATPLPVALDSPTAHRVAPLVGTSSATGHATP